MKVEDLPKYFADRLGIPADLVRSEAEREEYAQKLMQAAQGMQEAQGGEQSL